MKKLLSILLASTMLLSLSGCGKSDDSGKTGDGPKEYVGESEIDAVYTSPDKYKGKYIKLTGKVFGTPEKDEGSIYFQMYGDPENYERNTIVKYTDDSFSLKDGDYVAIDGQISGAFKGENLMGGTVVAPQIVASSLEIKDYKDAVRPTLKEVAPALTQEQHGCSITVDKIEFAKEETRVYFTVKNESENKFMFYSFDCKIVQDGKQYEDETNFDANYEEIPSELLSGVTASGVVTFPPIDSAKNFQVLTEGHSSNYREDFAPYTFDISVS